MKLGLLVVGAALCLLLVASTASAQDAGMTEQPLRCPSVFDGLRREAELAVQVSQTVIGAHWFGLGVEEVVGYEWAVVSQTTFKPGDDEQCTTVLGFLDTPEIDWRFVRKDTQAFVTDAKLQVGETYYVLLRTTLQSGRQVYSHSNGVRVVSHADIKDTITENHHKRTEEGDASESREKRAHLINPVGVCPIENANRCRQSQSNVGDFLRARYGPPEFNRNSQIRTLFRFPTTGEDARNAGIDVEKARENGGDGQDDDDDDDDDDSGFPGGAIAGIILGVLLAVLIFMILVALLAMALAGGKRDRPYKPRPASAAPASVPPPAAEPSAPDDTRVEFPDIDPHSRLSSA